ncbi:MAG: hypothetical protein LBF93_10800 [Zoogloeaceae bacterium]|nr:hypothetical protein [Zoogloeaceae bacterium]
MMRNPLISSLLIAAMLFLLLFVFPAEAAETGTAPNAAIPAPQATPPAPRATPAAPRATKPAPKVTPAEPQGPGDLYLRQVTLDEAAQLIARIGKTSIVVTGSVSGKVVSLYLRDVGVEGMIKNLCRAAGVWYRYDPQGKVYLLMSAQEYQQDIAIARDDVTHAYVLKHHNVISIANAIQALFGDRVELIEPVEEMPELDDLSSGYSGSGYSSGYSGSNRYSSGYSGSNRYSSSRYSGSRSRYGGSAGSYRRSGASSSRGFGDDLRRGIGQLSQEGLENTLKTDGSQTTTVAASNLLNATARQGAPINITYNLLHNLLLVRSGDDAAIRDIEALIRDMDRPPRQVLLEMRIVEVELGNDFRSVFDIGRSNNRTATGPMEIVSGQEALGQQSNGGYPSNAVSLGNFAMEGGTAVWQFVSDHLRARLQLLEAENRVNVLATPMVVAANNQIARLFIGEERVLVTGASAESYTGTMGSSVIYVNTDTEIRNIGQTLSILPRINADRSVTLTIDQDNSRVLPGSATLPVSLPNGNISQYPIDTVNTANLQVTAHARDGLTVAVGGMISQRANNQEEKVPLLGDIPIFGNLFKKTVKGNSRSQLVLLITPHVLETPEESDTLAQEKEAQIRQLGGAKRPHASIFDDAPPAPGYSSPLIDLLNPARSLP